MIGREVCVDTETTGLDQRNDRVIEIGCVEMIDRIPTGSTFHVYANPLMPIHPEAIRVHGITDEFVAGQPVLRKTIRSFLSYIGNDPLVIHNASFDVGMLNAELVRLDLPRLTNPIVDTLDLSKKARPGKKHNLDALARYYDVKKVKDRDKHGAIIDCQILAEVYQCLTGGLQMTMEALNPDVDAAAHPELPYRPERSFPGPTLDELSAHLAFIRTLKNPIWNRYIPVDDDDEACAF